MDPYQKRRKLDRATDFDTPYVAAPSTSRTAAKAAAVAASARAAAAEALRLAGPTAGNGGRDVHVPLLSLATLPPASIQKYLSRYGLLEPQGSLSYHHAVFPVPPLPALLTPPLARRESVSTLPNAPRRSKPMDSLNPSVDSADIGDNSLDASQGTSKARKRTWYEPKTVEFADVTAYDDPTIVVERLAAKAKLHWDKRDSVKEGETLTNFIFALRMRDKTLRATPPG